MKSSIRYKQMVSRNKSPSALNVQRVKCRSKLYLDSGHADNKYLFGSTNVDVKRTYRNQDVDKTDETKAPALKNSSSNSLTDAGDAFDDISIKLNVSDVGVTVIVPSSVDNIKRKAVVKKSKKEVNEKTKLKDTIDISKTLSNNMLQKSAAAHVFNSIAINNDQSVDQDNGSVKRRGRGRRKIMNKLVPISDEESDKVESHIAVAGRIIAHTKMKMNDIDRDKRRDNRTKRIKAALISSGISLEAESNPTESVSHSETENNHDLEKAGGKRELKKKRNRNGKVSGNVSLSEVVDSSTDNTIQITSDTTCRPGTRRRRGRPRKYAQLVDTSIVNEIKANTFGDVTVDGVRNMTRTAKKQSNKARDRAAEPMVGVTDGLEHEDSNTDMDDEACIDEHMIYEKDNALTDDHSVNQKTRRGHTHRETRANEIGSTQHDGAHVSHERMETGTQKVEQPRRSAWKQYNLSMRGCGPVDERGEESPGGICTPPANTSPLEAEDVILDSPAYGSFQYKRAPRNDGSPPPLKPRRRHGPTFVTAVNQNDKQMVLDARKNEDEDPNALMRASILHYPSRHMIEHYMDENGIKKTRYRKNSRVTDEEVNMFGKIKTDWLLPIMVAARQSTPGVLANLIKAGAVTNSYNDECQTPLHFLCTQPGPKYVKEMMNQDDLQYCTGAMYASCGFKKSMNFQSYRNDRDQSGLTKTITIPTDENTHEIENNLSNHTEFDSNGLQFDPRQKNIGLKNTESRKPDLEDFINFLDGKLGSIKRDESTGREYGDPPSVTLAAFQNNQLMNKTGSSINTLSEQNELLLREEELALMAQILVSKGTDIEHEDMYGCTALDYAKEFGHPEVMRVLLEAEDLLRRERFCAIVGDNPLQDVHSYIQRSENTSSANRMRGGSTPKRLSVSPNVNANRSKIGDSYIQEYKARNGIDGPKRSSVFEEGNTLYFTLSPQARAFAKNFVLGQSRAPHLYTSTAAYIASPKLPIMPPNEFVNQASKRVEYDLFCNYTDYKQRQ